jgi:hypothetical protein
MLTALISASSHGYFVAAQVGFKGRQMFKVKDPSLKTAARHRFPLEPTLLRTGMARLDSQRAAPPMGFRCWSGIDDHPQLGCCVLHVHRFWLLRLRKAVQGAISFCLLLVVTHIYAKQLANRVLPHKRNHPSTALQRFAYNCPFLTDHSSHIPYATSSARSSGFAVWAVN